MEIGSLPICTLVESRSTSVTTRLESPFIAGRDSGRCANVLNKYQTFDFDQTKLQAWLIVPADER